MVKKKKEAVLTVEEEQYVKNILVKIDPDIEVSKSKVRVSCLEDSFKYDIARGALPQIEALQEFVTKKQESGVKISIEEILREVEV